MVQYADGIQLILSGTTNSLSNLTKRAENILVTVKLYFQKNDLLLNEKKTHCIFNGSRHCVSQLQDNNVINFNENYVTHRAVVKN